jgi:hypothetical protein
MTTRERVCDIEDEDGSSLSWRRPGGRDWSWSGGRAGGPVATRGRLQHEFALPAFDPVGHDDGVPFALDLGRPIPVITAIQSWRIARAEGTGQWRGYVPKGAKGSRWNGRHGCYRLFHGGHQGHRWLENGNKENLELDILALIFQENTARWLPVFVSAEQFAVA